jgi:predicted methyltransferase
MLRSLVLSAFCALCAASAPSAFAAPPEYVRAALADPERPAADVADDAHRKPAELMGFIGARPGDRVVDLVPGKGYFTRIFSAVVGPQGQVYAVPPPRRADAAADAPDPSAPVDAIAKSPHYANVHVLAQRADRLSLPEPVDVVLTSRNYHDFHNVPGLDMRVLNSAVLHALKPGGTYVVIDHSAPAGSKFADTNTLHRIDEQAVREEVLAAGFEYVASSDALRNPADPRTSPVFDPLIRGQTDQFVLKFRKPK